MLGKKNDQQDLLESFGIRKAPKDHFLMKVDKLVKWYRLEKQLKKLYPSEEGRPSYGSERNLAQEWIDCGCLAD